MYSLCAHIIYALPSKTTISGLFVIFGAGQKESIMYFLCPLFTPQFLLKLLPFSLIRLAQPFQSPPFSLSQYVDLDSGSQLSDFCITLPKTGCRSPYFVDQYSPSIPTVTMRVSSPKDITISLRLSPIEDLLLRQRATSAGLSRSEYVRQRTFADELALAPPPPHDLLAIELLKSLLVEHRRISNSLHSLGQVVPSATFQSLHSALLAQAVLLDSIHQSIIGAP
jgi:hypothetical protein